MQWPDHVVVQEVEEGSRVPEARVERVAQHEHFVAVESPGAQMQESKNGTENDQSCEKDCGSVCVLPVRVFPSHPPPRRSNTTGTVFSMMRKSSATDWRRMYSRS